MAKQKNPKRKRTGRQKQLRAEKLFKKKSEIEADRLWHLAGIKKWGNICFFHNSGKEAQQHQKFIKFGHHIKPKGAYPHLRYEIDNFLNVCWPCHFKLGRKDLSMSNDVVAKRGLTWYNRLEKKAKNKPIGTFQTSAYYQKVIANLNQYLNA